MMKLKLNKTTIKKTVSIALLTAMVLSFAGCSKANNQNGIDDIDIDALISDATEYYEEEASAESSQLSYRAYSDKNFIK